MQPDSRTAPTTAAHAVVVTTDLELLDDVLAVAAAAGVEPEVLADAGAVRSRWSRAAMVLVGVDQAARVAALVLPRRTDVYVVGREPARDDTVGWSAQLGAAVVVLPEASGWLTVAMADAGGPGIGTSRLLAVIGGSGGVGVTTVATGLAFVAARHGRRTALVDLDPLGGGIDLLVGAERADGWRWPRLSHARGHLGDLTGQLPALDGVSVLSMARGPEPQTLEPDPLKAVLASTQRSHDLTVVDLPRALTPASREVLRRADAVVLVVQAELRGIAAAQQVLRELDDACASVGLLVRSPRARGVPLDEVADALGLPCWAGLPEDPALRFAAQTGDPPGRASRSALSRACRDLLDRLTPDRVTAS